MTTAIHALAATDDQANTIVKTLMAAGFHGDAISVLFPDKNATRAFAEEMHTKAPPTSVTGGVSGSVVGGALGWMVGIGMLAIPGIGTFFAAGPVMAMLSGTMIGVAAGGLAGLLIGFGMTEIDAKRYAQQLHTGRILISVHTDNSAATHKATQVLRDGGADDIVMSDAPARRSESVTKGAQKGAQKSANR